MATPYSNVPTQKPFSLFFATFITLFLLLAIEVNSAKAISFNFTKFTSGDTSITLQGEAEILSNGILALTNRAKPAWTTGRVFYTTLVPIWDSTTGNVASFVTSFSFVVEDYPPTIPADGLAFVIAPADQNNIPNNSGGGNLGLVNGNNAYNQFVAVEFDSYPNTYDPNYEHIGIDVNSLISLKTVKWERVSGALVKVSIVYDSLSKTLSVAVTNPDGQISTIAQVVDLKAMLPEKVRVGFSATTTESRQKHDIYSWSFTSTLKTSSFKESLNIASYA